MMPFLFRWKVQILMSGSASSLLERVDLKDTPRSRRLLRKAVTRLPERLQTILGLHYFEEMDWHQIADVLGMTSAEVEQQHVVALLRLRNLLDLEEESDEGTVEGHLDALRERGLVSGPSAARPPASSLATVRVDEDPSDWIIADRR